MPSKPYTVLVTGSSGHLGAALVRALPAHGHVPLGIDILPSPTTHHVASVTDRAAVSALLAGNPAIAHVVHAATLHKPHVGSHTAQAFVDTNVSGTLALLEAAVEAAATPLKSFVFVSTTSAFGAALAPAPGSPAAWIDEHVAPLPKNIYGVTKCAAEDLCRLVHARAGLPVVVLRTSRFFPEQDDDERRRASMADANLKVCELAHRRVDLADVVSAVVCAMGRAAAVGFAKYVVSAPPPFPRDKNTLARLDADDAAAVYRERVPGAAAVFEKLGWAFPARVDRVYDSSKAVRELGWTPEWTFERVVERLGRGEDWRSELTHVVGKKGYHAVPTGVYTT